MKFGIDKKIIILVILSIVVLSGSFGFYFVSQEQKALLLELDERANTLIKSMISSCEYPVLINDQEAISKLARGTMQQKDVVYCEIDNKAGNVLFKDGNFAGNEISNVQARAYVSPILTEKVKAGAEEELILGGAPVEKEMENIGKIQVVFTLDSLNNKLIQAKRTIVIMVLVGVLIISLASSWLIRFVLGRPIDQLVLGIENIAKGHLDYKVPIKTNDEIGMLAGSFNKMAEDLEKGTVSRRYLELQVDERTFELRNSLAKLRKVMDGITHAMALTLEMRDAYTAGHQRRVASLGCAIAKELHLQDDQIEQIRIAGMLHDIGKICVPAEILSKPSKLDKNEFNLMKTHSQTGYDILKNIDFEWPIAKIVLQHHERINGSGYPNGLKGGQILIEAKVLGVADVVEAMASDRPYRPALGLAETLKHIQENKGILYDEAVVDACTKIVSEPGFKFE